MPKDNVQLTQQQKLEIINTQDQQRKEHGSVASERNSLEIYMRSENQMTGKYKKELSTAGDENLLRSKLKSERTTKADFQAYSAAYAQEMELIKQSAQESGALLTDNIFVNEMPKQQATIATEYKLMLENCRIFDNEVRQCVKEVLASKPQLIPGKDISEQTELLSRLLTAYLPEREFHLNPPTKNQKSKVTSFLKSFKKDPRKAILNMQQESSTQRLHKDYENGATAVENFRYLYVETVKREIMGQVFPLMFGNQEGMESRNMNVSDRAKCVPHLRNMLKLLAALSGVAMLSNVDTEFNRYYKDPENLRSSSEKKLAREANKQSAFDYTQDIMYLQDVTVEDRTRLLEDYLKEFAKVREFDRNQKLIFKGVLDAKIAEAGKAYKASEPLSKKYREAQNYLNRRTYSIHSQATEDRYLTFGQDVDYGAVKVHSKAYLAENYFKEELQKTIQDANYTRYRRDRIKSIKPGGSLPKDFYDQNKQKEELRLRFLEQRIDDLVDILKLMSSSEGFAKLNAPSDDVKMKRLKSLYEVEGLGSADEIQEKEAVANHKAKLKLDIETAEKEFTERKKQSQVEGADPYSVPTYLVEDYVNNVEKPCHDKKVTIKLYELLDQELKEKEPEWKKADKQNNMKAFYAQKYDPELVKDINRQDRLEDLKKELYDKKSGKVPNIENIRNEGTCEKQVETEEKYRKTKLVFREETNRWNELQVGQKNRYVLRRLGEKDTQNYKKYTKDNIKELTAEEVKALLIYHDPKLYERQQNVDGKKDKVDMDAVKKTVEEVEKRFLRTLKNPDLRTYPEEVFNEMEQMRLEHQMGLYKFNVEHYLDKIEGEVSKKERIERNRPIIQKWMTSWYSKSVEIKNGVSECKHDYKGNPIITADLLKKITYHLSNIKVYHESKADVMDEKTADTFRTEEAKMAEYLDVQKKQYINTGKDLRRQFDEEMFKNLKSQRKGLPVMPKNDLKNIPDLYLGNVAARQAEGNIQRMEELIKGLSFENDFPEQFRQAEIWDQDTWLRDTKRNLDEQKKELSQEKERLNEVKEIQDLKVLLEMDPPVPEENRKIVTVEMQRLRRASYMACRCRDYLTKYKKDYDDKGQENLFRKKETYEAIQGLMQKMATEYMPQLENKLIGNNWEINKKELEEIRSRRLSSTKAVDPCEVTPDQRYLLKYARGYHALAKYYKPGRWSREKENKRVKDNIGKIAPVMGLVEQLFPVGFYYYNGLEDEKTEESLLANDRRYYEQKADEIEKRKKQQEEELKILEAEQLHQFVLTQTRNKMEAFLRSMDGVQIQETKEEESHVPDGEEILSDKTDYDAIDLTVMKEKYESFEKNAAYIKDILHKVQSVKGKDYTAGEENVTEERRNEVTESFAEVRGFLIDAREKLEATKEAKKTFDYAIELGQIPDIFKTETDHEEILALRENVKYLEDAEKELIIKEQSVGDSIMLTNLRYLKALDNTSINEANELVTKSFANKNLNDVRSGIKEGKKRIADLMRIEVQIIDLPMHRNLREQFEKTMNTWKCQVCDLENALLTTLKKTADKRVMDKLSELTNKQVISVKDVKDMQNLVKQRCGVSIVASKDMFSLGLDNGIPKDQLMKLPKDVIKKYLVTRKIVDEIKDERGDVLNLTLEGTFGGMLERQLESFDKRKNELVEKYKNAVGSEKEKVVAQISELTNEVKQTIDILSAWPQTFYNFEEIIKGVEKAVEETETPKEKTATGKQDETAPKYEHKAGLNDVFAELQVTVGSAADDLAQERMLYKPVKTLMEPIENMYNSLNTSMVFNDMSLLKLDTLKKSYELILKNDAMVQYLEKGFTDRVEYIKGFEKKINDLSVRISDEFKLADMKANYTFLMGPIGILLSMDKLSKSNIGELQGLKENLENIQKKEEYKDLLSRENPELLSMDTAIELFKGEIDKKLGGK